MQARAGVLGRAPYIGDGNENPKNCAEFDTISGYEGESGVTLPCWSVQLGLDSYSGRVNGTLQLFATINGERV